MDGESSAIASPFPAMTSSKGNELEMANKNADVVGGMTHSSSMPTLTAAKDGNTKVLPFEFRALEVCLESACRSLEEETSTLEQEAYPALDELTSKISTLNLERVRQIKSRLVAISGRVQKVRDELEHLLDDEMDMAEMYLTEKLTRQEISETSSRVEVDDPSQLEDDRDEDYRSEADISNGSFIGYKPHIEELEMLLEAYFVQIDGTLNKLSHLREYVDDTEDYINIMLDDKQNQLLQMGVMLSTATVVITAGVAVVGIFGMNIAVAKSQSAAEREKGGRKGGRSEKKRTMVKVATYFAMTFGAFLFWQSMDRVHVWIALHQDEKKERMEREQEIKRMQAELMAQAKESES
ncbi:hypothetical protein E2562_007514 [Oryza meyeriana var. granulata]|nr:hypothetical protein E2562_007514 [Oryza meyeriana var. granulata]KAF0916414.1 hypothetical protein E2562_007514 [Oryza meyeriana var. granulata]KAF0916415.1 hypothetical protein E2562_007514 [Oryza meyeriana var. granulata]KAF0916416.1 hypothetical protein E2562_007514 [Oryza meyeriana var. granulata]KAF0916417.1 hypothetical protein E2562_007514 [Oryza meyeriana var. granulata]